MTLALHMETTSAPRPTPLTPCPDWCAECNAPDPGVVDHYSQIWSGSDHYDEATWRVQVTQRVTNRVPGRAVVELIGAEGTYGSTSGLVQALLAADALAARINAEHAKTSDAAPREPAGQEVAR